MFLRGSSRTFRVFWNHSAQTKNMIKKNKKNSTRNDFDYYINLARVCGTQSELHLEHMKQTQDSSWKKNVLNIV